MKTKQIIILVLFFTGILHAQSPIPTEFQALYDSLDSKLDNLNAYVNTNWDQVKHSVVFSTELLPASPNRGEKILEPEVFEAVKYHLNRYLELGVTGISFDIKYPVLVPSFPRSSEYLDFFINVTEEVRKRNFTLLIAVQTAFTDSVFGKLNPDYSGLTLKQYKEEKLDIAQIVIDEMAPDYLTLEDEPTTQERNTGLDFSVTNVVDIVNYILDSLDRGNTLVGAGAGTWEDPDYIQSLAENTDIDFLDIHIYPVNQDLVIDRMETFRQIAQINNKRIALGETWLYKTSDTELANPAIDYLDIFPRDVFDFWIPLDQKFMELTVNLSHWLECDFTSLFWMRYFWGYIPYNDTTRVLSATSRYKEVDKVVTENMIAGNLTPTGETYRDLIQGITSVPDIQIVPGMINLGQNYPNPFNPETQILFYLSEKGYVSLKIYNILGEEIASPVNYILDSGSHEVTLDCRNWTAGIYFYRLEAEGHIQTKRMILLR